MWYNILMFRLYDYFVFIAAFASFVFSVYLWFSGEKQTGMYVGIWVPSLLALGIYGKLLRIVHFVLYRRFPKEDEDN